MGDIILKRTALQTLVLGVQHEVIRHSPSGFSWGSACSGSADLALNILLTVGVEKPEADTLYQEYMHEVIATIPQDGALIKGDWVLEWVKKKQAARAQEGGR